VWITNADGTGTFTAPNQPYFEYPAIIDPQETSPTREMKTHVPSTVTEVTIGIAISTDFPAEQNVSSMPPDTIPSDIYNPNNMVTDAPQMAGEFPRNIVLLGFTEDATVEERQLAVAKVNGTVVCGSRYFGDDGLYVVRIEDDGTPGPLFAAIDQLKQLSQVAVALPSGVNHDGRDYLKPSDDPALPAWSLDNAATGALWSFERIAAPMAWGCNTGSTDVTVGVIDYPFQDVDDLRPNVSYASLYSTGTDRHGTAVASIIGARGNNGTGISGMMWTASLRLYDRRIAVTGASGSIQPWANDVGLMASAARAGARIVNLSGGAFDSAQMARRDTAAVKKLVGLMAWAIRRLNDAGKKALYVFSAGNEGDYQIDTYFNGYPAAVDTFPAQVLVVGASTPQGSEASFSSHGSRVTVLAPGVNVLSLDHQGNTNATFIGTSGSAPLVSGLAGLLLSFDPSLSVEQVRGYIVQGAELDTTGADSVPVINAYRSLKLAAARPGAPLCGNHVWLVGDAWNDTIVVQRSGGAADRIWSDPDGALAIVNVKHGGHRISYSGPYQDGAIVYDQFTRTWQMESEDDSLPPAIDGGTYNSFWWRSHDGDSSLSFPTSAQTASTVTVDLYDSHAGTSSPLATVPTLLVNSVDSICVKEEIATHACESWGTGGLRQAANVLAAYSPVGDSAIISVARTETYVHDVSNWTPCGSVDSTGEHTDECRALTYGKRSVDTKFYTIPTNSFRSSPSVSWTMSGARATQLAITEDGSEVIIGHGAEQSLGGSQQFANCGITYRNRSTGQESPVISSEPACIYFGAATASPLRRPGITVQARE
jgi:hypothetical protein